MADMVALSGLKVVDFSEVRTGAQASQVLADFGADVIQVERPGGSPLRQESAWSLWGRGKRAVQLDLHDPADLAVAKGLAARADVVIETFRPGVADRLGIGYEALSAINPRLVHASISGFGTQGPLAGLQGYEGIVQARLGAFWALADMAPEPGRPAFASAAFASYPASMIALQGILAALYEREESGAGQHVEASLAQAMTVYDTFNWFSRVVALRYSDGFKQAPRVLDGVPVGGLSFRLLIALTKDGKWMQFSQTPDRLFKAMMKMFGLDWMFADPKWSSLPDFDTHEQRREFWEMLLTIVKSKTAAEWAAEFDRDPNVWAEQFRKGSELLDHPQMQFNAMIQDYDDPERGHVRQPGAIARMEGTPARLDRPAPALGLHDDAIRAEAAGPLPAAAAPPAASTRTDAPLAGVTLVELGTYYAGPYGATLLAELGARVIKLEQLDGDPHRNMLPFPEIAGLKCLQGKECVAVDLGSETGRAIAYRIIGEADMVLQSFRAGAADRLKLDAGTLRGIDPNLVYLNAPGYGEGGPCGHRPAFAPTIGAAAGMAARNAESAIPDGPDLTLGEIKPAAIQLSSAVMGVGNPDGLSAATAAVALLLALLARKRGAGGQALLTTMLSSTAHALSEVMVEHEGRPDAATANADLLGFGALYRLYHAADDWVFLAAPGEREWARLAAALPGGGALAADPRFATAEARAANDAALADALAAIFRTGDAQGWEASLRAADVACVVCAPAPIESHYLDDGDVGDVSGYVTSGHHAILQAVPRLAPLVRLSRSATVAGDAGLVGEHTNRVLKDHGYADEEIAALSEAGVILQG